MNVFLAEGNAIQGMEVTFNHYPISILRQWRSNKRGKRIVYAVNKGWWYMLSDGGMWQGIPAKPDVISMAELVDAIQPIKLKDIQHELPSDSFFS